MANLNRAVLWCVVGVAVAAMGGCGQAGPKGVAVDFQAFELGTMPPGFSAATTGGGAEGKWVVGMSPTEKGLAKVLAQTSKDPASGRFPVCVYDGVIARDVTAAVRFKPVSGKVDQAGGLVIRYLDKDNYYVARANALEDNVRFYKVVAGKREQIGPGMNTKVAGGQWHTLKLAAAGGHFTITFDDKTFAADDATFDKPGKAGLWTKADSVTWFDHLTIEPADKRQ